MQIYEILQMHRPSHVSVTVPLNYWWSYSSGGGVWYGCVTLRRTGIALFVLPTHVVSPVSGGRPICGSILGIACGAVVCRWCVLLCMKTEPWSVSTSYVRTFICRCTVPFCKCLLYFACLIHTTSPLLNDGKSFGYGCWLDSFFSHPVCSDCS